MDRLPKLESSEAFAHLSKCGETAVVHFFADWAPQCSQVTDALVELSKLPQIKESGLKLFLCPAEDLPEVSLEYKVEAVPSVLVLKGGKVLERVDGADVAKISNLIKSVNARPQGFEAESLEDRLKKLINRHKVMVFMKGDRNVPRCGFSRTLVQILNGIGIEYDTFDILTDEEVRQGLKEYSEWPTYPQVYVSGDLIGGLDIVKEMQKNGELESALKGA